MEDFIIKNLFHGGSGGFNGDGASRGHGNRGNIQAEHDRFIGRPSIGNKVVPAKHTNVITRTVPVIVLLAQHRWQGKWAAIDNPHFPSPRI